MRYKAFFWLCFFIFYHANSQEVIVLDAETHMPILGVYVFNASKSKSAITNENGVVSLKEFKNDEILIFQNLLYLKLKTTKEQLKTEHYQVFLTPNVEGLNEIVVSASKFEQRKRDIPQKILSFDAKDVQFSTPQTSADVLGNTGNVYIQKSQFAGGSPMIRGFSTNRLLITVDGVRMNNAIFRGGNLQNVISIDPFSIQKTEVTLGAGSVVYGSDAIGGVMGFYTKQPQLSYSDTLYFKANTSLRYATANNEKTAHVDFNFGLKKWAFLTNISFNDFDDLRMGAHGPSDYLRPEYVVTKNGIDVLEKNSNPLIQKPTGYNQVNLMQKVSYEPNNEYSFGLGIFYTETSKYPRYDRLIRYRNDVLRSAEWNYGPQRWFMANLNLTKLSSNSNLYDKLQVSLAFQNFQESRIDRDFQSEIRNTTKENLDALSFNLDLEKNLSPKTELFYGLEYIFNTLGSKGSQYNIVDKTKTASISRYPDGANWQSMAVYSSFKYKPNPKFVLQTGLRYNHILSKSDFTENNVFLNLPFDDAKINVGALTGTVGVSWSPNSIIQWKLNASTAFRAPNIDDVGKVFDSEPGAVVVPNNNLKAEYAYGGELSLNLNFDEVVQLGLSTYYTFLDNALVRRDFTINGNTEIEYNGELSNVQAIQNASKAWIYGFEMEAKINFSKQLKLATQYNIMGGTEEDNDIEVPVRHVVPNFGSTHLTWKKDKLLIDAFANYNNELSFNQLAPSETSKDYIYALDANGKPYAPSWYTLNLRTQYRISKTTTLGVNLENITDQRYKTYSSGIAAAGRNFIVTLSYSL